MTWKFEILYWKPREENKIENLYILTLKNKAVLLGFSLKKCQAVEKRANFAKTIKKISKMFYNSMN